MSGAELSLFNLQLCGEQALIRPRAIESGPGRDRIADGPFGRGEVALQNRDLGRQQAEAPVHDAIRIAGGSFRFRVGQALRLVQLAAPHRLARAVVGLIELTRGRNATGEQEKEEERRERGAGRHEPAPGRYGDHTPLVSTSPPPAEPPASDPSAIRTMVNRRDASEIRSSPK